MSVTWGLLSTARINEAILAGATRAQGVRVLAVASRDATRAQGYARERGIERAYGSYDELLGDPDVQAVYISLPNSMHVEWCVRALRAGKHVLCEKPLTPSEADAVRVFDVAQAEGLVLMEAFMWRHNPQTHRLAALLAEGAVGNLRLISAGFSNSVRDPGDVRMSAALEGGALMDVGCYCVSAARLLAGEPLRAYAEQRVGNGVDVSLSGVLRFGADVLAHFDCGLAMADRSHLEVVGDEGSMFVADPFHARDGGIVVRRGGHVERVASDARDSYAQQFEDMDAAIEGRAAPLLGRADGVGQARTIEALLRSAREGRAVDL